MPYYQALKLQRHQWSSCCNSMPTEWNAPLLLKSPEAIQRNQSEGNLSRFNKATLEIVTSDHASLICSHNSFSNRASTCKVNKKQPSKVNHRFKFPLSRNSPQASWPVIPSQVEKTAIAIPSLYQSLCFPLRHKTYLVTGCQFVKLALTPLSATS